MYELCKLGSVFIKASNLTDHQVNRCETGIQALQSILRQKKNKGGPLNLLEPETIPGYYQSKVRKYLAAQDSVTHNLFSHTQECRSVYFICFEQTENLTRHVYLLDQDPDRLEIEPITDDKDVRSCERLSPPDRASPPPPPPLARAQDPSHKSHAHIARGSGDIGLI